MRLLHPGPLRGPGRTCPRAQKVQRAPFEKIGCGSAWLWVTPKWLALGKWDPGLKPVPWWFNFDPHRLSCLFPPTNLNEPPKKARFSASGHVGQDGRGRYSDSNRTPTSLEGSGRTVEQVERCQKWMKACFLAVFSHPPRFSVFLGLVVGFPFNPPIDQ